MWFKTRYHLLAKDEKKRNGVCKQGGCDLKRDIAYLLRKKRNGVRKDGGSDPKCNITYLLKTKKKEMEFVSMENMIHAISLTC